MPNTLKEAVVKPLMKRNPPLTPRNGIVVVALSLTFFFSQSDARRQQPELMGPSYGVHAIPEFCAFKHLPEVVWSG